MLCCCDDGFDVELLIFRAVISCCYSTVALLLLVLDALAVGSVGPSTDVLRRLTLGTVVFCVYGRLPGGGEFESLQVSSLYPVF